MNLAPDLLPLPLFGAGYLLFAALLVWALTGINYRRWAREPLRQHLFFASSLAIMLLWFVRAGLAPGLGIHFLGMTALTLLLGWRLAMVGALFPLVGSAVVGLESWESLGLNGLLLVALPIGISQAIWRLADRRLPPNLFVYILGCGFFGSLLAAGVARLAVGGVLLAAGMYSWQTLVDDYLVVLPLALFPEGIINGMVVSVLSALRPEWMATLDTRRYLSR